eukprot:1182433-Pyramimonas_sp.AAC.1
MRSVTHEQRMTRSEPRCRGGGNMLSGRPAVSRTLRPEGARRPQRRGCRVAGRWDVCAGGRCCVLYMHTLMYV